MQVLRVWPEKSGMTVSLLVFLRHSKLEAPFLEAIEHAKDQRWDAMFEIFTAYPGGNASVAVGSWCPSYFHIFH